MSVTKDQILDAIAEMSVMDVVELVSAMETKFGVTAAVGVAVAATAEAVEEQTEFTVTLTSFGANKVAIIKAVRGATGLGLKEAKALVDEVPSLLKESVSKAEADELKATFEEAGATIEIK